MTADTNTTPKNRVIRCGFCIDGRHQLCCVVLRQGSAKTGHTLWRCGCSCDTAKGTRCLNCGRRGVEVVPGSTCLDAEECGIYVETKRSAKCRDLFGSDDQPRPTGGEPAKRSPRKPANPSSGQCLCCGDATRGGRFLPGHDARWLSQRAASYLETADEAIVEEIRSTSDALFAKFAKKVGL